MRLHLLAFQRKLLNQNSPPERQTSPQRGPIVPTVRSVSDILAPFWPTWFPAAVTRVMQRVIFLAQFLSPQFPSSWAKPGSSEQAVLRRGSVFFSEPFRSLCGSGKAPWFIRVGMDLCVCLIALHEWKQEPAREKAWRLDAVVAGLFWRVSEEVVFKYIKISH